MIVYNFNHRGPFEYDKFVLNALQFHNEVDMFREKHFDLSGDWFKLQVDVESLYSNYHQLPRAVSDELQALMLYFEF
jgi:hypothetical protein